MQPVNEVFDFPGLNGCQSRCGLRIQPLANGRVLVICTELPDNPGTSVTNYAEELATLVCQRYAIAPDQLVWVEHYPPGRGWREGKATWDWVDFTLVRQDGVGWWLQHPKWRPMRQADWTGLGLAPDPAFEER